MSVQHMIKLHCSLVISRMSCLERVTTALGRYADESNNHWWYMRLGLSIHPLTTCKCLIPNICIRGGDYATRECGQEEAQWNPHVHQESQLGDCGAIQLGCNQCLRLIQYYPGYLVGNIQVPHVCHEERVGDLVHQDQEDGGVIRVRIGNTPYL